MCLISRVMLKIFQPGVSPKIWWELPRHITRSWKLWDLSCILPVSALQTTKGIPCLLLVKNRLGFGCSSRGWRVGSDCCYYPVDVGGDSGEGSGHVPRSLRRGEGGDAHLDPVIPVWTDQRAARVSLQVTRHGIYSYLLAIKRSALVAPDVDLGECTLHSPPQRSK